MQPPLDTDLEAWIVRHINQHRTVSALARALHLPRETVEQALQNATDAGLISPHYVGHLAIYTLQT